MRLASLGEAVPSVCGRTRKRKEANMNHNRYDSYRLNVDLFKVLLGINLILFKLLLVWVKIATVIH